MSETDYKSMVANIESQIAASSAGERARLRQHLRALHDRAQGLGLGMGRRRARPEQDRIDDQIEAQFDNVPV